MFINTRRLSLRSRLWLLRPPIVVTILYMERLRLWLGALWRRSPSTVLVATVGTVVGVSALALVGVLVFANADDGRQPEAAVSKALSFAVLAGSAVNNTGPSIVNGDLGGAKAGNAITGFPPGIVNGTQHPADALALQAQADVTTAYYEAANRTSTMALPADLGGLTLGPGVYNQATDLGLTGILILDGRDDEGSVFIFQAGASLNTATTASVELINGARACNVFWQVGGSANLGDNTKFNGSILASSSVTVQSGATVNGRVLARNGDVNLETSTVTRPTCEAPAPTGPFSKVAPQSGADVGSSSTEPQGSSGSTGGTGSNRTSTGANTGTNPTATSQPTLPTTTTDPTVPTTTTATTAPTTTTATATTTAPTTTTATTTTATTTTATTTTATTTTTTTTSSAPVDPTTDPPTTEPPPTTDPPPPPEPI